MHVYTYIHLFLQHTAVEPLMGGLCYGLGQSHCTIGTSPHETYHPVGMRVMTMVSWFAGGLPISTTLGCHGHGPPMSFCPDLSGLLNPNDPVWMASSPDSQSVA